MIARTIGALSKFGCERPNERLIDLERVHRQPRNGALTLAGEIWVWEIGPDAWRRRACEAANELPSARDWSAYLVPFPPAHICAAYGVPQAVTPEFTPPAPRR